MTVRLILSKMDPEEFVAEIRNHKRNIQVDRMFEQGCYCKEVSKEHWIVESELKNGEEYDVDLLNPSCSCPNWTYRLSKNERRENRACKHIKFAYLHFLKAYGSYEPKSKDSCEECIHEANGFCKLYQQEASYDPAFCFRRTRSK